MNYKIEFINPINYLGWDDLVIATNEYSFFHSTAWAIVLSESYNFTPYYLTIIDNGELLVLMPFMEVRSFITGKRAVSMPFSDYGGPLGSNDEKLSENLNFIIERYRNRVKYLEFRCSFPFKNQTVSNHF